MDDRRVQVEHLVHRLADQPHEVGLAIEARRVRDRLHLHAARFLEAEADAVALEPRRQLVCDRQRRGGQAALLERARHQVRRERQARQACVALLQVLLAELVDQPRARPVDEAQRLLQRVLPAREVQGYRAPQRARHLDRIADQRAGLARRRRRRVARHEHAAALVQRLLRRRREVLHVARRVRPAGRGAKRAVTLGAEEQQRAIDAADLRAQDGEPARAELRCIARRGEACPRRRLGAGVIVRRQGVDGRGTCHGSRLELPALRCGAPA